MMHVLARRTVCRLARDWRRFETSIPAVATVLLLAAMFPACAIASAQAEPVGRPNIVLIMADDMGYSDLGCYGSEIRTTNLDRMARDGMRFTQFYNNAKCTTTRASLLTGLYPRPEGPLLQTDMVTVAELLRGAGYQTALSGKWHLGSEAPRRPSDRGFDEYYGLLDGACNFFDPSIRDPEFKGGRLRVFAHNDKRITEFPDDFYLTDAVSDYAVDVVDRFAGNDRPFFLHVCYTAPHYPLHAKPDDIERYRNMYNMGWKALRKQRHRRQIELGIVDPSWKLPEPDPEVDSWESAEHKDWQQLRMAVYAAMIDSMDQGIGRILAQLEKSGVADNTLVMFLSDNGGCAETPGGEVPSRIPGPKEYYATCGPGWAYAQNTPFRRFKQWVHEGGISTPLIVRWPGVVKPGTMTNAVGHIIDVLPTCVEVAAAEYPETFGKQSLIPVEGLSLVPLLEGHSRQGHEKLFWEWAGNRSVRQGKWKAAWDRTRKEWELYDLEQDRTETNNLAANHPDRVKTLTQDWNNWAETTGVKLSRYE